MDKTKEEYTNKHPSQNRFVSNNSGIRILDEESTLEEPVIESAVKKATKRVEKIKLNSFKMESGRQRTLPVHECVLVYTSNFFNKASNIFKEEISKVSAIEMPREIEGEIKPHLCIYTGRNQTAPLVDRKLIKQNGRRTLANASTVRLNFSKEEGSIDSRFFELKANNTGGTQFIV